METQLADIVSTNSISHYWSSRNHKIEVTKK